MYSYRKILFILYMLTLASPILLAQVNDNQDVFSMSFEELANIKITTATLLIESISDAPASVIIISSEDIKQRGYHSFNEIFNDLPSMDYANAFGDSYSTNYMRGLRTNVENGFLFMIDGMVMNHLWYNFTEVKNAVPLSNIKQIEIVYGPTSSVYGANALMGVINVITKKDSYKEGITINAKYSGGSDDFRAIDFNLLYKINDLRLRFTGYTYTEKIDENSLENFEYTKAKYNNDKLLWGEFINTHSVAGGSFTPINFRSISFAAILDQAEFGLQYYLVKTGWGISYPMDRVSPKSIWVLPDLNLYLKYKSEISNFISFSSLLRYRESDVSNEGNGLENWGNYGESPSLTFGYWQSLNRSWSCKLEFDIKASNNFSIKTGLKYEHKNLQKYYDQNYGEIVNPDSVELIHSYVFPEPPINSYRSENRIDWIEEGIYLQSKLKLPVSKIISGNHYLNFGIRYDKNSYNGSYTTIRAGYVGNINKYGIKLLYGESFKEPTPRQLYGNWTGGGSNPELKPEESRTFETYISYTDKLVNLVLNPFYCKMDELIIILEEDVINLGKINVFGFDFHFNKIIKINTSSSLNFWSVYSYLSTEEEKYNTNTKKNEIVDVGDMANHKLHFGITLNYKNLKTTFLGRYIGEINTVKTNPIKKIDPWFTIDLNLRYDNLISDKLGLSFKIKNLFNKVYFHPGIQVANSGNSPGYWENGKWYGSKGWHNSLLPQPGRSFSISFEYKY